MKTKIALHAHPSFFNPVDKGIFGVNHISEPCIPNLEDIETYCRLNDIRIAAITSYNTNVHYDPRFSWYEKEFEKLKDRFRLEYNSDRKILKLQTSDVVVLYTQEVKVADKKTGITGELNVAFFKQEITPDDIIKGLDYVIDKARDNDSLICVCHPTTKGFGEELTLRLLESGRVDCYEEFNALASKKANDLARGFAITTQKKGIAVSDAHRLQDYDSSYFIAEIGQDVERDLKKAIKYNEFTNIQRAQGLYSKFLYSARLANAMLFRWI